MFQKKIIAGVETGEVKEPMVIQKKLQEGTFGEVYQASINGQPVALKVFKVFGDNRFSKERSMCELASQTPSCVKLLATTPIKDRGWGLVFELCKSDLYEFMGEPDFSPIDRESLAKSVASAMLDALLFLLSKGIVHSDVKSENIFIREKGEFVEFVLGDMGSAFYEKDAGRIKGRIQSDANRAPEVVEGKYPYTKAIDVFSLGLLIYECFTGRMPVEQNAKGDYPFVAMATSLQQNDQVLSALPKNLRVWVRSMLDISPSRRISAERALACFGKAFSLPHASLEVLAAHNGLKTTV